MRGLEDARVRSVLIALVLFGCLTLGGVRLLRTGSVFGGDAVYYFSYARSLVIDRDLELSNEFERLHGEVSRYTGNRKLPVLPPRDPATGRYGAAYPVGPAVLLLPFFAAGHGIAWVGAALGGPPADGFGLPYYVLCAIGGVFYTALTLLLLQRLGRWLGQSASVAFTGALGILLGTAWLYYASLDPVHSHTYAAFAVTLFMFVLLRRAVGGAPRWWIVLGACGGLMGLVRYQDIAFVLLAPAALAWNWRDSIARPGLTAARLGALGLGLAAVISVQLAIHGYLYGDPFQTGHQAGGQGFTYLWRPQFLFTALSAESGFLRWAPVTALAFAGVWLLRRRQPLVAALCAAGLLGHWYVISAWDDLPQGDSFGNRHQVSCSVFLALGLMETVRRAGERWPRLASTASRLSFLGVLAVVNLTLMVLYSLRVIGVPY